VSEASEAIGRREVVMRLFFLLLGQKLSRSTLLSEISINSHVARSVRYAEDFQLVIVIKKRFQDDCKPGGAPFVAPV